MNIQTYAKRLQDWVGEQAPRASRGSLTKLHRRFIEAANQLQQQPITLSNLSLWRDGRIEDGLSGRSLSQLAAVRGESPAMTRAWLEGGEFTRLQQLDQLSLSDRARITPVEHLPNLIHEATTTLSDITLAIAVASQRLKEKSDMKTRFGKFLRLRLLQPKPHWRPYNPIPAARLLQEQTQPWSEAMLAEIINREYGLNEYTSQSIINLGNGIVDVALLRLIASLKIILDHDGNPLTDAALIALAEDKQKSPEFYPLDSQG